MAELPCPNCGRNNPDLLEVCQFCQTPLKPESVLRIGDRPTKKNTGELESVLPGWLKDVRQQARDSAEEEAAQESARPKAQKNEPPDLLAGLASQAGSSDEEEVPDWLANLRPAAKPGPAAPSTPAPKADPFAQFDQAQSKPHDEPEAAPPSWMDNLAAQSPATPEKDELSEWFSRAAEEPEAIVELDSNARDDSGWMSDVDIPVPAPKEPAPTEEEDLSWLRNLEEEAKRTGELKAPRQGPDWTASFETPSAPSQASVPQEDLSWLDSLGGIEETSQPPSPPAAASDDLSWLRGLESAAEASSQAGQGVDAAPNRPTSSNPFVSKEDIDGLNRLGGTSESPQPFDAAPPQEEPSWLKDLGGGGEPLSIPPFTETAADKSEIRDQASLLGEKQDQEATEPDWLKQAIEAPAMPAPGDLSMDWFTQKVPPSETAPSAKASQEKPVPAEPSQTPPFSDLFSTSSEPTPLSNQDVDSLLSMEMPDWLAHPEPEVDTSVPKQEAPASIDSEESLAPVDLPSWVQAMRPVEALISEATPSLEDQPEETEGPLAGLRGVIPGAPIGSALRPKPVALKLQATSEQTESAALLEQILGSETNPRALITSPFIASQQVLRWVLAGLILFILGVTIGLGSQSLPVSSAPLPAEMQSVSDALTNIPENGRVLVVVDYEPSLTGEMEAVAAPLLTHMTSLRHPALSFLSTSPTGAGLVERLLTNTNITGVQYLNLGYLPGGSAGVLGFIENPAAMIPAAEVGSFSEYAAVIVMTDHAESSRVWVEQLQNRKQQDFALTNQPLLMVTSAQAGPMLQPYVASRQINGLVSGLSNALRYEAVNNIPPSMARSYWDTFAIGLAMAVTLIVLGSLWSVFTAMRARRPEAQ